MSVVSRNTSTKVGAQTAVSCLLPRWSGDLKAYVFKYDLQLHSKKIFVKGAPLALTLVDDPDFTTSNMINDFDYKSESQSEKCPYTAHTRQNAPRTLDPLISKEYLDAAVIVRAGIPYGEEVSMPYASLTK